MGVALIADDDDVCRAVCAHALAATPFEPVHARTGASAIRAALECHPGLVLMDLNLPDLDACSVRARVLAAWPAACAKPQWLGMTASHETADSLRMLDAGFQRVLTKPFTRDQLLEMLPCPEPEKYHARCAGQDFPLGELQATFHRDLDAFLDSLDMAFAAADWSRCAHILHRLRGGAALAGYPGLARKGYQLETCLDQPRARGQLVEAYLDFLSEARDRIPDTDRLAP